MPWIGPDKRSWRERFLGAGAFRFTDAAPEFAFLDAVFFFDGDLRGAVLPAAAFFVDFFLDCFLLADFLADAFFVAFFVTFFRDAFLAAVFFGFRAADLGDLRVAVFRDDFLRAADFFFVDAALTLVCLLLTLRFLPVAFLPVADFVDAAFFRRAPADFRFLLAAFLAGIFDSCRSEKNAELYIACPNMEAQFGLFSRPSGAPKPPAKTQRRDRHLRSTPGQPRQAHYS